jgi:hypothetical protein
MLKQKLEHNESCFRAIARKAVSRLRNFTLVSTHQRAGSTNSAFRSLALSLHARTFPDAEMVSVYQIRLLVASITIVLFAFSVLGAANPADLGPRRQPGKLTVSEIREAEQMLDDRGYWVGKIDGTFDVGSKQGLIAFQKVEGRPRTGVLTPEELEAIKMAGPPAPRERGYSHIEIDLSRQVLFMVGDLGKVTKVLPVSTGNGKLFTSEGYTRRAITPVGRFMVYRKIKGWRKSPLGLLYYPNYILAGIAIHGNPLVPVTPASHGCIRIPMFAAKEFSRLTPIGTWVIVYDRMTNSAEPEDTP